MISTIFKSVMALWAIQLLFPGVAKAQPSPTVVFESGLGDGAKAWRKTIDALPSGSSVFTYDRPGYGKTPSAVTHRDPCTIATELRARLLASGTRPPYVLVGHSLGGQYAYAFARLFPQDVAGLILVDATAPGHWPMLRSKFPAAASLVKVMKATIFSNTMRREFEAQEQCLADLPQTPFPFAARVLVRTQPNEVGGEGLLDIEHEMAQKWMRMTGAAAIEPIARSGHYIQKDQPRILADIIMDVGTVQPSDSK